MCISVIIIIIIIIIIIWKFCTSALVDVVRSLIDS